jgi:hypothetical protein
MSTTNELDQRKQREARLLNFTGDDIKTPPKEPKPRNDPSELPHPGGKPVNWPKAISRI